MSVAIAESSPESGAVASYSLVLWVMTAYSLSYSYSLCLQLCWGWRESLAIVTVASLDTTTVCHHASPSRRTSSIDRSTVDSTDATVDFIIDLLFACNVTEFFMITCFLFC